MNFNKPTGTFETQGDLIQAWEKEVEKELNEYPSTLEWQLEETDIACPDCSGNLCRCYVEDPHGAKIYSEVNTLYCPTDEAFYNQSNLTWVQYNGSGGGGGGGSYVRTVDGSLVITDA